MSATTTVRRSHADKAWALMLDLWLEHRDRLLAASRELGLSPPQLFALRHLDAHGLVPMGQLAQHLQCDNSNVTGIVDRLEERGLVERRAGANDRRVKHLALTASGVRMAAAFNARIMAAPPALERLSAADQRTLHELLGRVLEHPAA